MLPYQQAFLDTAIRCGALRFGEFTLKSGRISPYFFNAGEFSSGRSLADIGEFYARALLAAGVEFDMLFGPAYKGIPLASVTAAALWKSESRDVPVCFNRKEEKKHGEGGRLMGAPLQGRVMIVDDVITAGTAIRESIALVEAAGARVCGAVVALDREERGHGARSTIQELDREFGFRTIRIAGLSDLVAYLEGGAGGDELLDAAERIRAYRDQWGVAPERG